ncbi:MAG: diacylglycerol kinase family protein [Casimicrobium sp.]
MSSILVLLNPHAGGGRAMRFEPGIRARIRTDHPGVRFVVTESIQTAHELIGDTKPDARIVLVGGDGTVNRMLPALTGSGRTLAIVPMGSGNDIARALGLHKLAWPQALAHAITAPASPMDVGQVAFDDRTVPFLACCTSGFDSAVALRALNCPRWLRGLPRYLLATLRELAAFRTWHLTVHSDGKPLRAGVALFASALNAPTFGSGIPIAPQASINDGLLDLIVAGRFTRMTTLVMLPKLLIGRHLPDARIHTSTFTEMQIDAQPPVPLAVDGEYIGETAHLVVRLLPAGLLVVARTD